MHSLKSSETYQKNFVSKSEQKKNVMVKLGAKIKNFLATRSKCIAEDSKKMKKSQPKYIFFFSVKMWTKFFFSENVDNIFLTNFFYQEIYFFA